MAATGRDVFDHVFASIQSLNASGVEAIDPSHFDVVIVDEFHHAAAASYERLLTRLQPAELLGLTATPERADGLPILHWFGDRIAAELRLWDAIDQHRLVPFSYFGIADNLDLRDIPWRRGSGYDVERLTNAITANDVWARAVVQQFRDRLGGAEEHPCARILRQCRARPIHGACVQRGWHSRDRGLGRHSGRRAVERTQGAGRRDDSALSSRWTCSTKASTCPP